MQIGSEVRGHSFDMAELQSTSNFILGKTTIQDLESLSCVNANYNTYNQQKGCKN